MTMNEHHFEEGSEFDISMMKSSFMETSAYAKAHEGLCIPCHDVMIEYEGGLLLVKRLTYPVKDVLWPIGGRILRGMSILDSLKQKVKDECGLDIGDVKELGVARTFFKTDPFGHGKGTDTINIMFFAKGSGELKLNDKHYKPIILKPVDYTDGFRVGLHPYVVEMLDLAMPLVEK
ncbi:hypothetical protein ACFL0V_01835 [Nanoarchaeota archaeon]